MDESLLVDVHVVSTGSGLIPRKGKEWQSKKGRENEQEKDRRKEWYVEE